MAESLTRQQRKNKLDDNAPRRNKPFPRNKKKRKKHAAPIRIKRGEPVFIYACQCHDAPAKKPPCERDPEDRRDRKFSESSLGHWHCSITGKNCKVRRQKNKLKEETRTQ